MMNSNDFMARQLPSAGTNIAKGVKTIVVRALTPVRVNGQLIEVGKFADIVAVDAVKLIAGGEAERAE
jgi:hypothetical protein